MKNFFSFALIIGFTLITSCSKKKDDPKPDPAPSSQPLVYAENTQKISANSTSSTNEDIANGTMIITDAAVLDAINVGSVLYSEEGEGYLVKVSAKNGSTLTVEPASLDQLFTEGDLNFSSTGSGPAQKTSSYNFSVARQVFNESGMTVDLSGTISFDPTITGNISFTDKTFNASMQNAPLNMTLAMDVNATPDAQLNITRELVLGELSKSQFVSGVVVTYKVTLTDRITVTGTADINQTLTYTQNNKVSASVDYNNGWTSSFNFQNVSENIDLDYNFQSTLQIRHEIIPHVEVKFYGLVAPYFEFIPYNNLNFKAYADMDGDVLWNFNAENGLDFELGVTNSIFEDVSYSHTWPLIAAEEFYSAPKTVEIVSGNNQSAEIGQQLTDPLVVKVLDSENNPIAGAMVHFEITEGTGVLTKAKGFTNSSGTISTNITVSTGDNVVVKAIIKSADGQNTEIHSQEFNVNGFEQTLINNSPWNVTAYSYDNVNMFSLHNTDTLKCSSNPQDTMIYINKEKMTSGSVTFGTGSGSFSKVFETQKHTMHSSPCYSEGITTSNQNRSEGLSNWTYDASTNQITTDDGVYNVSYGGNTLTLTGTKTVNNESIAVSISMQSNP